MHATTNRQLFINHIAQTSPAPIGLEIVKAEGCHMWAADGNKYFDLISGFSVMNIGHGHPSVIHAIAQQTEAYMHLMVYGEMIQSPQVKYAEALIQHLPKNLNCVYFTNSGSEATEGAMKLAKRYSGRTEIIAFTNAYHGSTQGALSLMGNEYWRQAYRPLLPDVKHLIYNEETSLAKITTKTACVVAECIQAEAGVVVPKAGWLQALRKKCSQTGTILIIDEIQTGFGRTGSLWAFEQMGFVPDILLLGKALGGGMPLGAFIANKEMMQALTLNPVLGHISTFAGHPVSCAAGLAAFLVLLEKNEQVVKTVFEKEKTFTKQLAHPQIKHIQSAGLLMAIGFESFEMNQAVVKQCLHNGLITDWFLFNDKCLRIAPPLIITEKQIVAVCQTILKSIDEVMAKKTPQ